MAQPRKGASRLKAAVAARLDKNLTVYMAAGAAGAGLLATPRSAEGKIVYTATNVSMVNWSLPIDLDNDGNPDFVIIESLCGSRTGCVFANPLVTGNGVRGSLLGAFAGAYGIPVGPQGQWLAEAFMAAAGAGYGGMSGFSNGPWANTTNKYLGLKFLIDGKTHYGWARLTVKLFKGGVTLTGYAYETIPNHGILEGHTQGLSAEVTPPAALAQAPLNASLGTLACGAVGLAIWRREDEVASSWAA